VVETSGPTLQRRRTSWDLVLGALSALAGVFVLGHVAFASLVSILFVGWMLLVGGIVLAISAVVGWSDPTHRWDLASGALLAILGLGLVRNPGVGLLVLTLLAGSLLLLGGVVRLVAAFQDGAPRAVLAINGIVTILLGMMVLLNWPVSAVWFLGTILGVQLVLDGITLAAVGRIRVVPAPPTGVAAPA
jgi:membrane protein HdeD